MKTIRWTVAGTVALVLSAGIAAAPAGAQERPEFPLAPVPRSGNFVAPFFDGFFLPDADGNMIYSFGFLNRNDTATIEIPLGPDNFITPAEFDGMQPTYFPTVNYGGFGGPRERGSFAVLVPAGFTGDIVWTLRSPNGTMTSVPGRATSVAYELSLSPQAAGSVRPAVSTTANGPEGFGPLGVMHEEALQARVGQPLAITTWGEDRGERDLRHVNMTWVVHQAPVGGVTTFEPATVRVAREAEPPYQGTANATFSLPGEYVIRVRVDNFGGDSAFGNMCCWSNAYYRVNVAP